MPHTHTNKQTNKQTQSQTVTALRAVIAEASALIDEVPPIEQPMRFGNKAFRTWRQQARARAPTWVAQVVATRGDDAEEGAEPRAAGGESAPVSCDDGDAVSELITYLCESFGNETRVDYGSGHELSFVAFLAGLFKLGLLSAGDAAMSPGAGADDAAADTGDLAQTGLLVFNDYILLCRKLQTVYLLEPAGSHGVWGLDDYQFVPFYLGAAQLTGHAHIKPRSIHDADIVVSFARDYMYLACIEFINKVKTGPFFEHSMYLNDVSNVVSWKKINSGLLKMYEAEVLGKFPVIQHFPFGKLLKFDPKPQGESQD
jgi:serine/threonine-protein phosphatase 2A activator